MKNIKYFFDNILRKPFILIVVVFQIIITTSILIPTIKEFFEYYENQKMAENCYNNKKLYSASLKMDCSEKCADESFDKENLKKMYDYLMENKEFHFLYQMESNILIKNFCDEDKFYYEIGQNKYSANPYTNVYGNYSNIKAAYVNYKYYKHIELEVEEGRNLKKEDFNESDITPVVLGYDYKNIYKVGDTFTYFDYMSKKVKKLKVVGILKKNIVFYSNENIEKYNQYIIAPLTNPSSESNNSDYLMRGVNGGLIETKDYNKAVKLIENEAKKTGVGSYSIESCTSSLESYLSNCRNEFLNSLKTSIIIFIFVFVSITTIQLNDIKKRMREYGIHLLNGASKSDIIIQNFYTICFYVIFGVGIGYYVEYISSKSDTIYYDNFKVLLTLIIIFSIFIVVVEIILCSKLKNIQINKIIRGDNYDSNRNE